MAGEDTQILANGNVEALTIIPPKMANGNGLICGKQHNNNGSIPNGKLHEIAGTENGKLIMSDEKSSSLHTEFDDADVSCGWGPCRPHWLQYFATKQAFLVTFCITWVLQGMYYTYFVSVITTIEKLFQIQSKTTGIIMSATEIGQIGSSLLLTYYGGQGHRPKWIAWGMILFAVSSFTCSMPHFIFGEQLIHQNEMFFSGVEGGDPNNTDPIPANLCKLQDRSENATLDSWNSSTASAQMNKMNSCEGDSLTKQRIQIKITTVVLAIFFVSLLGVGMGQTAVYTLGIPYIDDNVASRESPLYFAITIGVRILGPALGFILGSLCTMIYADLSANPQITPTDPRWVGAWWLGLVLISAMLMLVSIGMFAFPTRLPASRTPPKRADAKKPSLRAVPRAPSPVFRSRAAKLPGEDSTRKIKVSSDVPKPSINRSPGRVRVYPVVGFVPFATMQPMAPSPRANMAAAIILGYLTYHHRCDAPRQQGSSILPDFTMISAISQTVNIRAGLALVSAISVSIFARVFSPAESETVRGIMHSVDVYRDERTGQ
ncbi:solute carrier organic anion transporter family member 74D-like [Lasioglossum baleicum]|uniref:solute carrier organic anion transporter family member 74D-like n=1 Tax=Lasioglossum baleicum TaxID=434251 RepID=UPI003FCD8D71